MKRKMILIISVIAVLIIAFACYNFIFIKNQTPPKYPSTYFIEPPSKTFVSCYTTDDCIKIKGTACPPSRGGIEVCINKNYMQEYLSKIELSSGNEWDADCPEINNTSNKECSCADDVCKLVNP